MYSVNSTPSDGAPRRSRSARVRGKRPPSARNAHDLDSQAGNRRQIAELACAASLSLPHGWFRVECLGLLGKASLFSLLHANPNRMHTKSPATTVRRSRTATWRRRWQHHSISGFSMAALQQFGSSFLLPALAWLSAVGINQGGGTVWMGGREKVEAFCPEPGPERENIPMMIEPSGRAWVLRTQRMRRGHPFDLVIVHRARPTGTQE